MRSALVLSVALVALRAVQRIRTVRLDRGLAGDDPRATTRSSHELDAQGAAARRVPGGLRAGRHVQVARVARRARGARRRHPRPDRRRRATQHLAQAAGRGRRALRGRAHGDDLGSPRERSRSRQEERVARRADRRAAATRSSRSRSSRTSGRRSSCAPSSRRSASSRPRTSRGSRARRRSSGRRREAGAAADEQRARRARSRLEGTLTGRAPRRTRADRRCGPGTAQPWRTLPCWNGD